MNESPSHPAVEWIRAKGEPIACILRRYYSTDHTEFFTEPDMEHQLGILVYAKDAVVAPHTHQASPRKLNTCPECLFVRRGSCEMTLYDHDQEPVSTHVLKEGDVALLLSGGHGFRMLEACELIETRAGAYPGDAAKITL